MWVRTRQTGRNKRKKGEIMTRLAGKVALVTGAGMGLGAAIAEAMVREGASVICADINRDATEAVADALQNAGGKAAFQELDVTDEAAWDAVVQQTQKVFGGLDIVVNNAGVAPVGKMIEDLTLAEWRRTLSIDLDSVFLGCKYAIRAMKEKGGSIINVSSIMGIVATDKGADYCAAKGGVRLLTKAAAVECATAGYNIRVNSIHPGFIDTPLVKGAIARGVEQGSMGSDNEAYELLAMLHPLGRLGYPKEIADAAIFLASGESSFMTGSEVVVDGGYTAR